MKFATLLALGAATAVTALPAERQEKFLIKTSDFEQKWVTQEEKWELRRV
jgi:hypothetical protein